MNLLRAFLPSFIFFFIINWQVCVCVTLFPRRSSCLSFQKKRHHQPEDKRESKRVCVCVWVGECVCMSMTSQPKPSSVEPTRRTVVSLQPYLRPEDQKVLRTKKHHRRDGPTCAPSPSGQLLFYCLTYILNLFYYETSSGSVFWRVFDKNASRVCLNSGTGTVGDGILFSFRFFCGVKRLNLSLVLLMNEMMMEVVKLSEKTSRSLLAQGKGTASQIKVLELLSCGRSRFFFMCLVCVDFFFFWFYY